MLFVETLYYFQQGGYSLLKSIADFRVHRGLTQEQVAAKLDISRAHYTNIENGKRLPSISLAGKIAHFFGCTMDELPIFNGSENGSAKYFSEFNQEAPQAQIGRHGDLLDLDIKKTKGVKLKMAIQDKLRELSSLDGFVGVGVYTVNGESIAALGDERQYKLQQIGAVANNVMINTQKACIEMGTGREDLVHISGEKAHILIKCHNEGTDPLKPEPGKAHIHMVLILNTDSSIGLAKIRLKSVIQSIAAEVRV